MSEQPRYSRVQVEDQGDVAVVSFTDAKLLGKHDVQTVEEQLFRLVDGLGRRKVLIDFAKVKYVSSPVLGTIIALNKKLTAAGGQLELRNIEPRILEVFRLTGLSKLFNLEPSANEDDDSGGIQIKVRQPAPEPK